MGLDANPSTPKDIPLGECLSAGCTEGSVKKLYAEMAKVLNRTSAITTVKYYKCYPCHSSCKACVDTLATNCTKCDQSKSSRLPYLKGSECVAVCPQNYYFTDDAKKICKKCHQSCMQCDGEKEDKCLKCNQFGLFPLKLTTKCYKECPLDYFKPANQYICEQCDASCKRCNGKLSSNCLECKEAKPYLKSGTCVDKCDST